MPSGRRLSPIALTAALVSAAACRVGTDLPADEPDQLEQLEAEAIVGTLVLNSLESTVFSEGQVAFTHSHGPLGAHSHPIGGPFVHDFEIVSGPLPSGHNLFNVDFAYDLPCAGGGSLFLEAAAVGEGNPLTQPGFVDYELGHELRECVVEVEELDWAQILITTPPYVTGQASVRFDGASDAQVTGFLEGGLAWEGESKAGSCDLSLTFEAVGTSVLGIDQIPVTGTFCELEIERSYPRQ
jgi:hypothetical protein